jgi:triacylglycerol lipase
MTIERSLHFARVAALAYKDGDAVKTDYNKLGYTHHKFIDIKGAQMHACWNNDEMVLAFRGTEPNELSDVTADLNVVPDRAQVGGWVHNGFQNELEKLWKDILVLLADKLESRKLYICGHSLGAAMATIAASRLNPYELYTYGSPRVGSTKFIKNIHCPHYRHVNNNDIVTKVPFAFLGYRHHGTLCYMNFYGNIRKMTFWQRIKDSWRGRVAALKKGQAFDGIYDHKAENYVKYLEKNNGK